MSLDEFDEEAQNLLVGAIAQVMDVNSLQVSIAGITAKELRRSGAAHRLLLAQGVQVDIEITTEPPAAAPSIDAINAQLALVGLPQATLNDSASGVIITGEYRLVIQYLPFCPRNFQLRSWKRYKRYKLREHKGKALTITTLYSPVMCMCRVPQRHIPASQC